MRVVAFVPDLMDRSRLTAPAAAAGVSVQFVGSAAALAEAVGVGGGAGEAVGLVLVDLGRAGALEAVRALPAGVRVVGFASHVDDEVFAAATASGVEALARSAFFRRVEGLLGRQRP